MIGRHARECRRLEAGHLLAGNGSGWRVVLMSPRCDRCRVEYSSGCDYGGKDYCMTCYSIIRSQEEQKRRQEEEKIKEIAQEKKRLATERYIADEERRKREQHDELRRRELVRERDSVKELMERKKEEARLRWSREEAKRKQGSYASLYGGKPPAAVHEEMRQRRRWEEPRKTLAAEEAVIPFERQKKARRRYGKQPGAPMDDEPWGGGSSSPREFRIEERKPHKAIQPIGAKPELLVKEALPVSASIGQKGVKACLLGKNPAMKQVGVELKVFAFDSKRKKIGVKSEPSKCQIGAQGEQSFNLLLDLPEDASRGPLTLEAYLSEDAFFIDEEDGKSETVMLHTQVKTPMDLQYKKGSGKFVQEDGEEGSGSAAPKAGKGASLDCALLLCLAFDNVGESGGLVSKKSKVLTYADDTREEMPLARETKVKGLQKNVILKFCAREKRLLAKSAIILIGVDANGKTYEKREEMKSAKEKGKVEKE